MTAYATLTREFITEDADSEGYRSFVWYAEKDNYNDASVVLNNSYLKAAVIERMRHELIIDEVVVTHTGTVGVVWQGSFAVGTDPVTYTPWPLEEQETLKSPDHLFWSFNPGVHLTIDKTKLRVAMLILAVSGYAATDDVDVTVRGRFR